MYVYTCTSTQFIFIILHPHVWLRKTHVTKPGSVVPPDQRAADIWSMVPALRAPWCH